MEVDTIFFDTYAFFEIIEGNEAYKPFLKQVAIITTRLNLMELHYGLMRKFNKGVADKYFGELRRFCIDFDDETILEANQFRLSHKAGGISYIDALGYTIAKRRGVLFLTGDRQFKGLENVEYVV